MKLLVRNSVLFALISFALLINYFDVFAFEPVYYTPINPVTGQLEPPKQDYEIYTTYGYYKTNNGFQRIRIKIKETKYGIYLIGYYDKTFGWQSGNNLSASTVSKYTDGDVIAQNFDYKVYSMTLCTDIYF